MQFSNVTEESMVSNEDSLLNNEDDEKDECNEGPVGPGFKDTSLDRITRFTAEKSRRIRIASGNLIPDAMTVLLADFLRHEIGQEIIGDFFNQK